jgi:hypothetical protein
MDEQKQRLPNQERSSENFESDTQKLVREHMADPNHEITDEDLAKVRVGMSPGPDAPTQQAVQDAEERVADKKKEDEDDILPGAQKMTPWDLTT